MSVTLTLQITRGWKHLRLLCTRAQALCVRPRAETGARSSGEAPAGPGRPPGGRRPGRRSHFARGPLLAGLSLHARDGPGGQLALARPTSRGGTKAVVASTGCQCALPCEKCTQRTDATRSGRILAAAGLRVMAGVGFCVRTPDKPAGDRGFCSEEGNTVTASAGGPHSSLGAGLTEGPPSGDGTLSTTAPTAAMDSPHGLICLGRKGRGHLSGRAGPWTAECGEHAASFQPRSRRTPRAPNRLSLLLLDLCRDSFGDLRAAPNRQSPRGLAGWSPRTLLVLTSDFQQLACAGIVPPPGSAGPAAGGGPAGRAVPWSPRSGRKDVPHRNAISAFEGQEERPSPPAAH